MKQERMWRWWILLLPMFAARIGLSADAAPLPQIDDFSISLFEQLQGHGGNLICSPLSARTAMAMAALGARGETAQQINNALASPISQPALDLSQLQLANSLWIQKGFTPNDSYRDAIRAKFSGELNTADFQSDPNAAGQQINHWVAENTADKIPTLFPDGSLKNTDRLVIVNAIYLRAEWAKPFEKRATSDAPFTVIGTDKPINLPTMHGRIPGRYFADNDLEMITLPYKGNDLSMTILLPRKADGLSELEKSLTSAKLSDWLTHDERSELNLSLPKWKSGDSLELVPVFQAMGVRAAFTRGADFSGISETTRLQIGRIVQKAVIDVNEAGTEAAAATGIEMRTLAAFPRKAITVNVDHPFLFFLQANPQSDTEHGTGGSLLFLGRVTDPRGS